MRKVLTLAFILLPLLARAQGDTSYVISTIAGAPFNENGIPATSAPISYTTSVAVDSAGNLYLAERVTNRVRMVSPSGTISTVAGIARLPGYFGDGNLASKAQLSAPSGVAVDSAGSLYIADRDNQRIRIVASDGTITTFAGTGEYASTGDGGPAAKAALIAPTRIAVDASGAVYICESPNQRIRKITASGMITTVAGTGELGFSGDGGPAASAKLNFPVGVAVDGPGNLYIADSGNNRIRKVAPTGTITTIAGNGLVGFNGDGSLATLARLNGPMGVAADRVGNLFIADTVNRRIRRVSAAGVITTIAGTGAAGFGGDGGSPLSAQFSQPEDVAVDSAGNVFVADHSLVRKIAASGVISTVAGATVAPGDGGPASSAPIFGPSDLALDRTGNLYISDVLLNRVRKITADGVIRTVAGNGMPGSAGDGGPALSAELWSPHGLLLGDAGNLYIADSQNNKVRKVSPDGAITTIAGSGAAGYSGDGAPATEVALYSPLAVAQDRAGNLYIADLYNDRVRKVTPGGTITTFAGTGTPGFSGDGAAASAAQIHSPTDVEVDAAGNLFIADSENARIRKVAPSGLITTVAGSRSSGFSGDGGPATQARLDFPIAVAPGSAGNLYIADANNNRIRKVSANGIITTIAGTGVSGFGGDGGPATLAQINTPVAVQVDKDGNVYLADRENLRVRKLTPNPPTGLVVVSGNGQTAPVNSILDNPLVVRVVGKVGVGVPGVIVGFAVTEGNASLGADTVITGADGSAGVDLTFGDKTGTVVVTATVAGIPPLRFTSTAIEEAAPPPGAPGSSVRIGSVVGGALSAPVVRQISPNGIVTIFGDGFAPPDAQFITGQDDLVDGKLPTRLGGVCVLVGADFGRLLAVFPKQINLQAPETIRSGSVPMQVVIGCGTEKDSRSNIITPTVQVAAPELFFFAHNPDGKNPVAAVNAWSGVLLGSPDLFPGESIPARPGDIVALFGTGFGATNPAFAAGVLPDRTASTVQPVRVTLGPTDLSPLDVLYAGVAPGLAGVYQVNIRIPASAPDGDQPLTVRVGGFATPRGAFLTIKR